MKTLKVELDGKTVEMKELSRMDIILATRVAGDVQIPVDANIKNMTAKQAADSMILQDCQVVTSIVSIDGEPRKQITSVDVVFDVVNKFTNKEWGELTEVYGKLNGVDQDPKE